MLKSRFLHLTCFLLASAPLWSFAQISVPSKTPRDAKQGTKTTTISGPASFKAGVDEMVASGKLSDRLVTDAEWIKKYAATITPEDLEAHLRFIASDELEGRETGTRGQKVAARYLATQFMKMGLQPGNKGEWYQKYDLDRVTVNDASLTLNGKDVLKLGEGFYSWSKMAMTANLEADMIFAGFGIADAKYNNLAGLDLRGKIAVILPGEPKNNDQFVLTGSAEPSDWSEDPGKKYKALIEHGAKGVITVQADDQFDKMVKSNWMKHNLHSAALQLSYKNNEEGVYYTFNISESTANSLLKKSKTNVAQLRTALNNSAESGKVDLSKAHFSLKTDAKIEKVQAENVLGFIEGTDKKEEIVVISAHYDHLGIQDSVVFNGADDDGTGTVAVLEIAEAFMQAVKEGHRPRRSILFLPVSGEEKGLLGSEYYSDHPVYPLNQTVCDLNIDMIGRVDEAHKGEPQYIYVIGSDKLSTQLHITNEAANHVVANLELDYTFNSPDDPNQFYYRSDHYNFAKHNIPVIFYFSGVHEDYHKSTDDIEKILFPRATRVAQLVFATAWEAANRDNKFVVDKKNDFQER